MNAPNGTKSEYTYDGLQRLTQVKNLTSASAVLSQYGYTIDNSKSIRTAMAEQQGANPVRQVSYGYDATDQLKLEDSIETNAAGATSQRRLQETGYDAMGNRTNLDLGLYSGTDQHVLYTHNKLNRLTGMSVTAGGNTTTTAFAYDASGNMTQQAQNSGGSTYTYDDADRLISLVQKDTSTGAFTKRSDYVYDGLNRKAVSREYSWDATLNNNAGGWVQSEEKRRVYSGMDVMQERDGNNVTTVNYTRSGNIGGILSRSDSNGIYFFSYDGSGNVVGLTDGTQQTVAEYSYDAWGGALRATGLMASVNTYRYSNKEYQSASGLYDYGLRFYSPGLGRWINRDPIQEKGGLNLYGFVLNNPVNLNDLLGLTARCDCIHEGLVLAAMLLAVASTYAALIAAILFTGPFAGLAFTAAWLAFASASLLLADAARELGKCQEEVAANPCCKGNGSGTSPPTSPPPPPNDPILV